MKLSEVAARLECRLDGDGDIDVRRVAGLEAARADDLSFFANPRYAAALRETRAAAVILADDADAAPCPMLRTPTPYLAFARAVALFADAVRPEPGVDPSSHLAGDVRVGDGVSIGPFVSVGSGASVGPRTVIHSHVSLGPGVVVGADCVIHSHVAVRERVVLGDRVVLQNAAVIGSDGYGFAERPDGTHEKIPQMGDVVIEDDVEIGAHVAVDRPAVGETRIQAGAKIDNLVQIGHGVHVGRHVLLAAQVGVAGSTTIEDAVVLAGQVGVNSHVTVGKGTRATGQSGITHSVPAGSFISGLPAIDNRTWRKAATAFRTLPDLRKRVLDLERRLARQDGDGAAASEKTDTEDA